VGILGDQPTSIDASAYAFLANILLAPVPSETQKQLAGSPTLVTYVSRMRDTVYGH
jgi:Glutathione S-transferase, C-terminal domain